MEDCNKGNLGSVRELEKAGYTTKRKSHMRKQLTTGNGKKVKASANYIH